MPKRWKFLAHILKTRAIVANTAETRATVIMAVSCFSARSMPGGGGPKAITTIGSTSIGYSDGVGLLLLLPNYRNEGTHQDPRTDADKQNRGTDGHNELPASWEVEKSESKKE